MTKIAEVAVLARLQTGGLGKGNIGVKNVMDELFQTFLIGGGEGEGVVVARNRLADIVDELTAEAQLGTVGVSA